MIFNWTGSSGEQIPAGVICMWSGSASDVPSGWALCNGSNGTPDLRDRFIVGAGSSYNPGVTGGSKTQTLTVDNLPAHAHTLSNNISVTLYGDGISGYSEFCGTGVNKASNATKTLSLSGSTSKVGSGTSFSILPPYYALCFIMKI